MVRKMESLLFDDGYESLAVNGNPTRIIRFNPADPEIINRVLDVQRHFKDYSPPKGVELDPGGTPRSDMERGDAYVAESSREMRKTFNGISLSDVYDTIFVGRSPLCIVGQKYLYEGVLKGLLVLMKPAVEEYTGGNREKSGKRPEDIGK